LALMLMHSAPISETSSAPSVRVFMALLRVVVSLAWSAGRAAHAASDGVPTARPG
jgi:hypothetical protein